MGLKRRIKASIERLLEARIVRPKEIALLFEEEHLRRFFDHFAVDCVFDVGANAGQYATMLRERTGYKGPIISFEPNPDVAAALRQKAQRDACWYVEELALSSAPGQMQLHLTAVDQLSSLHAPQTAETELFNEAAAVRQMIDVNVSTLEIELARYRQKLGFKRPFLKMDTQGHDVNVASGAGKMLSEFVGLQSELAMKRIYADTPTYQEALAFYTEHGFVISAFVPNNTGWFPYLIEMDCIMFHGKPE